MEKYIRFQYSVVEYTDRQYSVVIQHPAIFKIQQDVSQIIIYKIDQYSVYLMNMCIVVDKHSYVIMF